MSNKTKYKFNMVNLNNSTVGLILYDSGDDRIRRAANLSIDQQNTLIKIIKEIESNKELNTEEVGTIIIGNKPGEPESMTLLLKGKDNEILNIETKMITYKNYHKQTRAKRLFLNMPNI